MEEVKAWGTRWFGVKGWKKGWLRVKREQGEGDGTAEMVKDDW